MSIAQSIYDTSKPSHSGVWVAAREACDKVETDSKTGTITYTFEDGSCLSVLASTHYVLIEGPRNLNNGVS